VWLSSLRHIDLVGVGCGLVPLLLGGGWLLSAGAGRTTRERQAFALLAGVTIAVIALETASFDLRFGGAEVIRDRYLFYIVPLLLAASAAALTEERRLPVAVGVVLVTPIVAATAHGLPFTTLPRMSVDSPASLLNETLIEQSGTLGTGTFVAASILLLGAVLAIATVVAPRLPTAIVLFVALLAFSVVVVRAEFDRVVTGTSLAGRPLAEPSGIVLDWVDSVLPAGATATLVPFPVSTGWGVSAITWWDVEFWNRTITRSYVARDGNFAYTGFPQREIEIDPVSGVLEGTARAPRYVVAVPGDPRFALAGTPHARNVGLVVVAAERPYRAVWSTRGVRTDGWTRPGVPATVRVHPRPGSDPEVARVSVRILAPGADEARYTISAGTLDRSGRLAAGAAIDEVVLACVGPRRPVDVTVAASTSARVAAPRLEPELGLSRLVGVRVGPVSVEATGRGCDA